MRGSRAEEIWSVADEQALLEKAPAKLRFSTLITRAEIRESARTRFASPKGEKGPIDSQLSTQLA